MARAFGLLLIVCSIWLGLELMSQGSRGAFGGLLVDLGVVSPPPAAREETRMHDRARARFQEAYRTGVRRVEDQLRE